MNPLKGWNINTIASIAYDKDSNIDMLTPGCVLEKVIAVAISTRKLHSIPIVAVQMMRRMAALDGTHSNLQRHIGIVNNL